MAVELPLAQRQYRRIGVCCRCGECCRTGDPVGDGSNVVRGEVACALYREDEREEGRCTDRRHPYYLSGCNVWPSKPEHIADKPSCTYSFVEVTGGD
jgi:hypothetical protein